MALRCGLVGLPNCGKSTLFNALTKAGAQTALYPFSTIDPNVGVMEVADERLDAVAGVTRPKAVVSAAIEYVDLAGLVKGANRGEGLGNQFLAHIREVDALLHIVRAFQDPQVPHVDGTLDPVRDIETVSYELLLADLETVAKRQEKTSRKLRSGERRYQDEVEQLKALEALLGRGVSARHAGPEAGRGGVFEELFLLTAKPTLYVVNVGEKTTAPEEDPLFAATAAYAKGQGAVVIAVPAKLEAELVELEPADRGVFLNELGWAKSTLPDLVRRSFALLDLVTFFTVNENELHAWTVPRGTTAPAAAGKVHSRMEKGFIRAEAVDWSDLVRAGSMAAARESGRVHVEGREYRVKDGDILYFRFNP